jgi:hypothetical protein
MPLPSYVPSPSLSTPQRQLYERSREVNAALTRRASASALPPSAAHALDARRADQLSAACRAPALTRHRATNLSLLTPLQRARPLLQPIAYGTQGWSLCAVKLRLYRLLRGYGHCKRSSRGSLAGRVAFRAKLVRGGGRARGWASRSPRLQVYDARAASTALCRPRHAEDRGSTTSVGRCRCRAEARVGLWVLGPVLGLPEMEVASLEPLDTV